MSMIVIPIMTENERMILFFISTSKWLWLWDRPTCGFLIAIYPVYENLTTEALKKSQTCEPCMFSDAPRSATSDPQVKG